MFSDVRSVVFDLDGTLLDRRRSFERFVGEQWERFAHVLNAIDQEEYVRTLIVRDRDGYAPRNELFTGIVAHCKVPSVMARTLLDDYRAGFPRACVLFPDAAQTLSSLRAAGPEARAHHERLHTYAEREARMAWSSHRCSTLF
jgi:putative hydrolase of the HAD superfamily